jgi:hypothetical protein
MPFFGIKEILEPFLRGASEHPTKALFQKGPRTFSMSTSFDGGLLDHLAELYFFVILIVTPNDKTTPPPCSTPAVPLILGFPITNADSQLIVTYSF